MQAVKNGVWGDIEEYKRQEFERMLLEDEIDGVEVFRKSERNLRRAENRKGKKRKYGY